MRWIALIFSFCAVIGLRAPAVEFEVNLPSPLVAGYQFDGSITISGITMGQVDSLELPVLDGMRMEQRGYRQQLTMAVGGGSGVIEVTVSLLLNKPGTYDIPPFRLKTKDGKIHSSPYTTVEAVDKEASNPSVEAFTMVNPTEIYTGEEAIVSFRVVLPRDRRIRPHPEYTPPLPEGLTPLGEAQWRIGFLLGDKYSELRVFTVEQQVTATRPGTYDIGANQQMDIHAVSSFGNLGSVIANLRLRPSILTVKQFPQSNRPADFYGLTQAPQIATTLEDETIPSDAGTRLTVTLTGMGAHAVTELPFPDVPELKAYPQGYETGSNDKGERTKTFTWQVVPRKTGSITIPGFSLPFFNKETERYQRVAGNKVTLAVLPGRQRTIATPSALMDQMTSQDLPSPIGHKGSWTPPGWLILAGFIIGSVVGLAIGGRHVVFVKTQQKHHRGRALSRAMAIGDLDKAATLAHEILPTITDTAAKSRAVSATRELDRIRYGGGDLSAETQETLKDLGERR